MQLGDFSLFPKHTQCNVCVLECWETMRPQCPKFKIKIAKKFYVVKSSPSSKGAVTNLNGTQAWQQSHFKAGPIIATIAIIAIFLVFVIAIIKQKQTCFPNSISSEWDCLVLYKKNWNIWRCQWCGTDQPIHRAIYSAKPRSLFVSIRYCIYLILRVWAVWLAIFQVGTTTQWPPR